MMEQGKESSLEEEAVTETMHEELTITSIPHSPAMLEGKR